VTSASVPRAAPPEPRARGYRRLATLTAGLGIALGLSLTATPAAAASWRYGAPSSSSSSRYVVRQGDTYWGLARRFGTTVAALEAANPGDPAWDLYPGLVLRIPAAAGAAPASDGPAAGGPANAAGAPATQTNIDLLARIAAAEEGNRSLEDQIGVDAVVLNRVASGQFPGSVAGVIFQPGQFASVSNGYYYNAQVGATSILAAEDALAGDDPVGGALYFYDPGQGITSTWIFTRSTLTVIDGTVFAI
jgi:N-acetylmuramoyl-L-alanine amidase